MQKIWLQFTKNMVIFVTFWFPTSILFKEQIRKDNNKKPKKGKFPGAKSLKNENFFETLHFFI